MKPELYMACLKEIVREVVREEMACGYETPADYRIAAGYGEADELASALKDVNCEISSEQLRRYERGELANIDDRRVVIRIGAIAKFINVPATQYRAAVRRQMDKRSAK